MIIKGFKLKIKVLKLLKDLINLMMFLNNSEKTLQDASSGLYVNRISSHLTEKWGSKVEPKASLLVLVKILGFHYNKN